MSESDGYIVQSDRVVHFFYNVCGVKNYSTRWTLGQVAILSQLFLHSKAGSILLGARLQKLSNLGGLASDMIKEQEEKRREARRSRLG